MIDPNENESEKEQPEERNEMIGMSQEAVDELKRMAALETRQSFGESIKADEPREWPSEEVEAEAQTEMMQLPNGISFEFVRIPPPMEGESAQDFSERVRRSLEKAKTDPIKQRKQLTHNCARLYSQLFDQLSVQYLRGVRLDSAHADLGDMYGTQAAEFAHTAALAIVRGKVATVVAASDAIVPIVDREIFRRIEEQERRERNENGSGNDKCDPECFI